MTAPVVREKDPLTITYNKLWDMLEAHQGFTDLVRVGNRVKFAGDAIDPDKDIVSEGDLPQVGIMAETGGAHLFSDSNASRLTERYGIIVVTGDKRLTHHLYPVRWEVFRAMSKWQSVLTGLKWDGNPFQVTLARPTESSYLIAALKGVTGWTMLWGLEVDLHFGTTAMQA